LSDESKMMQKSKPPVSISETLARVKTEGYRLETKHGAPRKTRFDNAHHTVHNHIQNGQKNTYKETV
jgi:hypothetical protein